MGLLDKAAAVAKPPAGGSAAAPPGTSRNYHLPGDADVQAWTDLVLPFAGRLKLAPGAGFKSMVKAKLKHVVGHHETRLVDVDVWLQSGLHYREVPAGAAAPKPGDHLPVGMEGAHQRGFQFRPLRRDGPAGARAFDVHVERASDAWGHVTSGKPRWVVTVCAAPLASPFEEVRFVAASKAEAQTWERQLIMRAVPMTIVWSKLVPASGGGGPSVAGPSSGLPAFRACAVADAVQACLPSDALTGVAGVVTALTLETSYNLAVAAGPLAGFVLGMLCTAVRVCVAARDFLQVASTLQVEVASLADAVCVTLLPAADALEEAESVAAAITLDGVADVAARLDVIAGELLHLCLSLGSRVEEALASGGRMENVALVTQVSECQVALTRLQISAHLSLSMEGTKDANRAQQALVQDRRMELIVPRPSDRIFGDWADAGQPWSRLRRVVLRDRTKASSAAGGCVASAHGMGGVGKTTSCQLVARVEVGDGGCFPDGVFWVKLGQDAGEATVIERMRAVATVLQGKVVTAPSVGVAVTKLRDALADHACLMVVDDCWNVVLAQHFVETVNDSRCRRCCVLLSTRVEGVAKLADDGCCVEVGNMSEATARSVLLGHARPDINDSSRLLGDSDDRIVVELLRAAAGLPLALAVLGSLVRKEGWAHASELLGEALSSEDGYPGVSCPSLWTVFAASYNHLGAVGARDGSYQEQYNALCVVDRQVWLPTPVLAALWDVEEDQAKRDARYFAGLALATVRTRVVAGVQLLVLGLHDLLIDFLRHRLVSGRKKTALYHAGLVNGYAERFGSADLSDAKAEPGKCARPWWTLATDEYMVHALCRHLLAGGKALRGELMDLLCDARWIERRVADSSGTAVGYRADCRVSGEALMLRVATVVEGALATAVSTRVPGMQQVAFELAHRLVETQSAPTSGGGGEPRWARQLMQSADRHLDGPRIKLDPSWALDMPRAVGVLHGHEAKVTCSCTVVDALGQLRVVSGSSDKTLRVWDVASGECVAVLRGHAGSVLCVCVVEVDVGGGGGGGGGKVQRVVSGSTDKTLRVWDVASGECVAVLWGHAGSVLCVCVVEVDVGGGGDAGGGKVQWVVCGSADKWLRVWDVASCECVAVLSGHKDQVICVCVIQVDAGGGGGTGGGKVQRVVSGSCDGTLRVWDMATEECVARLGGDLGSVKCMCVVEVDVGGGGGGRGGMVQRLVSGSSDQTLRVWDMASSTCVAVLRGHTGSVTCACVAEVDVCGSGGGRGSKVQRVVSGSWDKTLRVWDVASGECVAVLSGHTGWVECVSMVEVDASGDGGGGGGKVQRVVSLSYDETLRVWDVSSGTCVAVLNGHTGWATSVCVAEVEVDSGRGGRGGNVQRMVSGSMDKTLRVWDVVNGVRGEVLSGHTDWVTFAGVVEVDSSGGGGGSGGKVQRVVSGSMDKTLRVWDMASGKCVAMLNGHTDWVTCTCMLEVDARGGGSTGGGKVQRVVSGSGDGSLRVWDVASGKCVAVMSGHKHTVSCMCVVQVDMCDGYDWGGGKVQRVVSGSGDGTLRVWDVESWKCMAVMKGHVHGVLPTYAAEVDGVGGGRRRGGEVPPMETLRDWGEASSTRDEVRCSPQYSVTCACVVDVDVGDGSGGGGGKVQRLVSASKGGALLVWDLASSTFVALLSGHTDRVTFACVVEVEVDVGGGGVGGKVQRVVSGSDDGTLRVWDVAIGKCVATLRDHSDAVTCSCVVDVDARGGGSTGGGKVQHVVSGSRDKTLRLWDIGVDGGTASVFRRLPSTPTSLELVPDRPGCVFGTCEEGCGFLLDVRSRRLCLVACPPRVRLVSFCGGGKVLFGTSHGSLYCGRLLLGPM